MRGENDTPRPYGDQDTCGGRQADHERRLPVEPASGTTQRMPLAGLLGGAFLGSRYRGRFTVGMRLPHPMIVLFRPSSVLCQ